MAQIRILFRSPIIGVVALFLNSWLVNAQGPPRRILLLYPYDNVSPATLTASTAIRKRLAEMSPSNIDGMGLSICRSIAVAHGGQLSVSPGHPHGSVFQLDLPTHQPGTA